MDHGPIMDCYSRSLMCHHSVAAEEAVSFSAYSHHILSAKNKMIEQ